MPSNEELPHDLAPCIELGRALRQLSDALVRRDLRPDSAAGLCSEPIDPNQIKPILGALAELGLLEGDQTPIDHTAGGHPLVQTADGRAVVLATHMTSGVVAACTRELHKPQRDELQLMFFGRQSSDVSAVLRGRASAKNVWQANKILLHAERLLATEGEDGKERIARATDALREAAGMGAASVPPRTAHTLLVGNGLNRLTNNISWNEVLDRLARKHLSGTRLGLARQIVTNLTVPSPIKFEYLSDFVGTHGSSATGASNPFKVLKDDLAIIMQGLDKDPKGLNPLDSDLAALLGAMPLDYVLTTNYDELLEQSVASLAGLAPMSIPSNTKYLFAPTSLGGPDEPTVFHPHGIARSSGTICIGYEHYMGYVQRLRERLIVGGASRESAWRLAYLMLGAMPLSGTWEELFFTSDLAIVGLGMDYEESDLWELLILRAAVLNTSDTLTRYLASSPHTHLNSITFYDVEVQDGLEMPGISDAYDAVAGCDRCRSCALRATCVKREDCAKLQAFSSSNRIEGKADVLKGLSVNMRVAHAPSYIEGYKLILEELNRNWT